ncbi:2-C-methyl-D-erythritol 4-phosphate cytidylyltransferase [Buchnera aphidicola]|uniref:2-C-methyl-D-erythritol 4-phosphate cytidylyltransferase n=1 Tax=Buchnera aphidicola TaxID=9 RepID=UPI00346449F3
MTLINSPKPKIMAVVPAAGIGRRMQLAFPKQYIKIKNFTILEYTLKTLLLHPNIVRIIVSLHQEDNYFHKLPISSDLRILSVLGGPERIYSVLSGLMVKTDADLVMVHDAVRPCLSYKDLENLISTAKNSKVGGILVRPVSDTIKCTDRTNQKILHTIPRKQLWHALTPQLFPINLLRLCLKKIIQDQITITDESSALEYCGHYPEIVLGSHKNIKITYPEDIVFARLYLKDFFKK